MNQNQPFRPLCGVVLELGKRERMLQGNTGRSGYKSMFWLFSELHSPQIDGDTWLWMLPKVDSSGSPRCQIRTKEHNVAASP